MRRFAAISLMYWINTGQGNDDSEIVLAPIIYKEGDEENEILQS